MLYLYLRGKLENLNILACFMILKFNPHRIPYFAETSAVDVWLGSDPPYVITIQLFCHILNLLDVILILSRLGPAYDKTHSGLETQYE